MATLQQLVKAHGEEKIVKMVESYLNVAEKRKEYSSSPEAKQKAKERRIETAKEIAEFRVWKQKTKTAK